MRGYSILVIAAFFCCQAYGGDWKRHVKRPVRTEDEHYFNHSSSSLMADHELPTHFNWCDVRPRSVCAVLESAHSCLLRRLLGSWCLVNDSGMATSSDLGHYHAHLLNWLKIAESGQKSRCWFCTDKLLPLTWLKSTGAQRDSPFCRKAQCMQQKMAHCCYLHLQDRLKIKKKGRGNIQTHCVI